MGDVYNMNMLLEFLKTHQELQAFSLNNFCRSLLLLSLINNKAHIFIFYFLKKKIGGRGIEEGITM